MVLMGYDSSVFNSVQGSNNWRVHFNNPVRETDLGAKERQI
jgi:hypothetical protein